MSPQAQLVLLLWLPVILYLFQRFPSRTAIIYSFVGGFLFLPRRTGFKLPLIPDYEGMTATCYGILIATFLYDRERFNRFKFHPIDIPMLCWCCSPILSSLTNDLGFYDGFNTTLEYTAMWGLPYFLGRLYLDNLAGMSELAVTLLKGGILYIPMGLYEIKASPQIHNMVYGFFAHPSGISQSLRGSTYRPSVFMEHGLVMAMFMFTVTLTAVWLWQAQFPLTILGQPMSVWSLLLILTLFLIKSSGAYGYLIYGFLILFVAKFTKLNIPILLIMALIIYYLYLGVTGQFDGEAIVDWIATNYDADRAQSLGFRFFNEESLRVKAQERMLFGWGGWGRNRIFEYNSQGELVDKSVTDSQWIITFGINGVFGLASLTTSLLLPVFLFAVKRYPAKTWFHPKVAPSAVLGVCLTLFVFDSLLNVTFNPTFPLICGGLSGLVAKPAESLTGEAKSAATLSTPKTVSPPSGKRPPFPQRRFP